MAKSKRQKKSRTLGIIVGILITVVVVLVIFLVASLLKNKADINNDETQTTAGSGSEGITDGSQDDTLTNGTNAVVHSSKYEILPNENGIPVAQIDVDINGLKSNNADTCGWIYIPDADVNCAVVCNESDPDYYLTNDISGLNGVFMQNYNNSSFSDRMSVIYGKNQNGKSQFEGILKFRDKSFFNEHKYLYVATEDKILTYRIFTARKAYAEHLMLGYDWSEDQVFLDYLIYIIKAEEIANTTDFETATDIDPDANIDETVDISVNDKVLTLSQRIEGEDDYRYLVQAVLVNESIKETN